jgi:hypothetical protein
VRRTACAALALAAIGLSGCESTQEKSAQLEREAHSHTHASLAKTISVGHENPNIEVLSSTIVSGKEGAAVVVSLRNSSPKPIVGAPIEIMVKDAKGSTLYSNATPGLSASLTTAPPLKPHAQTTWIDDQVLLSGSPSSVKTLVGEGQTPKGSAPSIQIEHVKQIEGGQSVTGTVANHSAVAQRELVVYAVARRGSKVVAAGRGIVPEVGAHASEQFEAYLIGEAKGASVQLNAPPTSW